jgi:predicted DNA-binding transcriptional regulator YafY
MAKWTFITNHGAVLARIATHSQVTAAEIATELEITERSVRRIIADLVEAGYLRKKKVGRNNQYKINPKLRLRRPGMRDVQIEQLLDVIQAAD